MKLHLVQSLRLAIRSILRNPLLIVLAIVAVVCIQSVLLGTLFGKSLFGYSMTALEKRVDIRLSLVQDINESDKQKILSYIESAPNVENAKLISRSDIYTGFQTRHSNDFLTNQALKELDVNPFGDEIVVHLDKPTTHSAFIESLNDSDTIQSGITALIEDIDTIHNDTLVQKLTSFQRVGSTIGLAALLVSTTIVVLVLIVLSYVFEPICS